jgi:hypothetical protein
VPDSPALFLRAPNAAGMVFFLPQPHYECFKHVKNLRSAVLVSHDQPRSYHNLQDLTTSHVHTTTSKISRPATFIPRPPRSHDQPRSYHDLQDITTSHVYTTTSKISRPATFISRPPRSRDHQSMTCHDLGKNQDRSENVGRCDGGLNKS